MGIGAEFSWPEGKRAALSLTFDDARHTQITNGLPILDAYGVKATFYVMLGAVKARLEAWKDADANGHEIGNHSLTHPCSGNFRFSRHNPLEEYTLERMEAELAGASQGIHDLLGVTPRTFAYPCGQTYVGRGEEHRSYVPLVAQQFEAGRGFQGESANDPTYCDPAHLLAVSSDTLTWEQLQPWIDSTLEQGHWLILVSHEVGEPSQRQTMPAETLEQVCRYAGEHPDDLWVDTVANINAYITRHRNPI